MGRGACGLQSIGLQRVRHDLATKQPQQQQQKFTYEPVKSVYELIRAPKEKHFIQISFFIEDNITVKWVLLNKILEYYKYNSSAAAAAKSLQSCPTLCNSIDSGPPGSPVPGILQARTLEWVAIAFSNA